MQKRKVYHRTIQKVRAFCKHCSLHGVYYFHDHQHWLVYAIWSTIIIASLILCVFLSQMIWQKFNVDPTFTVVETTHYPISKISFPSVILCDTEMVYGPNTENITHILTQRQYTNDQINDFYSNITAVNQKNYVVDPEIKKMHSLLQDLGIGFHALLDMLKKPCDVLLVECVWRSRPHNCSDMFRQVYTFAGFCCQFDMEYFKHHADVDTNFVAGVQASESLDITVNGQQLSPSGSVTDGYVSMFILDRNVTLVDSGVTLTPGGYFDTQVFVWAIDSSKDVKALAMVTRKCLTDTDTVVGPNFYNGCMTMLIIQKVVNYCRCIPFKYSSHELNVVGDYAPCTWDRMACIYSKIEQYHTDVRNTISQTDCLQRCDYVQYVTEIEYIRQQRLFRDPNETYSKVLVHFPSNTCMKYRREVLYTWDQMLANLGGIFGLCLGGSIISIIELIWFFVDLLCTVLLSRKPKVTPNKIGKAVVFTLTERDLSTKMRKKNVKGVERFPFVH